jgi:C1A family cysteine protease
VSGSSIASFVDVEPSSDDAMMTAVSKQPVSVAIEADQKDFQLYKSGVFTASCGTNLDHGVLVVGYGTMDGQDYYKVKNSWASTWGADGYIYLGRGSSYNNGDGQCGVLLEASYPVL